MTKIDLEALDRADEIESVDSMLRRLLPVVADSWEQLRGSDVYRLLSMVREDRRAAAANRLRFIRQDLIGRVDEAMAELAGEQPVAAKPPKTISDIATLDDLEDGERVFPAEHFLHGIRRMSNDHQEVKNGWVAWVQRQGNKIVAADRNGGRYVTCDLDGNADCVLTTSVR